MAGSGSMTVTADTSTARAARPRVHEMVHRPAPAPPPAQSDRRSDACAAVHLDDSQRTVAAFRILHCDTPRFSIRAASAAGAIATGIDQIVVHSGGK